MPLQSLVLYSTTTLLAHTVAERYYGTYYVWCSPHFDSQSLRPWDAKNPPTADPCAIYHSLFDEVQAGDLHSLKMEANRTGILRGAAARKASGAISGATESEIIAMVNAASLDLFRPLVYVIPFAKVKKQAKSVPVEKRANALSEEYIIEVLPRDSFDIIELRRRSG